MRIALVLVTELKAENTVEIRRRPEPAQMTDRAAVT